MPLKTLFLNPPSFENFDGGAGSRWPATREIEYYWYPVWLAYPAGMLEGSRLLDANPHHVSADQTIEIGKDYGYSPYDSLMLAAALIAGCTTIYSEDMQSGQVINGTLTIKNPFM